MFIVEWEPTFSTDIGTNPSGFGPMIIWVRCIKDIDDWLT